LYDVLHAQWSLRGTYLQVEYLSKIKIKKSENKKKKQGTTPFFLGDFSSGTFYEVRGRRPLSKSPQNQQKN
jgi:hypothetical protein